MTYLLTGLEKISRKKLNIKYIFIRKIDHKSKLKDKKSNKKVLK